MKSLYARLRTEGLSPSFVRAKLLPDWWDDSLADNPANLAIAEVTLARNLGLTIRALRDPAQPLSLDLSGGLAFKRSTTAGTKKARASVRIAVTAATTLVSQLERLPAFGGRLRAEDVRKLILARARSVDLESLLEFAWGHGIVVLPFRTHPTESSQFDGLATWISGRPVIILASRRQAPAWLAFHLAHELGHILLGHVLCEGDGIVDVDLQKADDSDQELQADRFESDLSLPFRPSPGRVSIEGFVDSFLGNDDRPDSVTAAVDLLQGTRKHAVRRSRVLLT